MLDMDVVCGYNDREVVNSDNAMRGHEGSGRVRWCAVACAGTAGRRACRVLQADDARAEFGDAKAQVRAWAGHEHEGRRNAQVTGQCGDGRRHERRADQDLMIIRLASGKKPRAGRRVTWRTRSTVISGNASSRTGTGLVRKRCAVERVF